MENKEGKQITVLLDRELGDVNEKQVQFLELVMKVVSDYRILQKKEIELEQADFNDKEKLTLLHQEIDELSEKVNNDYRYFWYGGSIRAGKTFIQMTILVIMCKMFRGMRAHVIRGTFPKLKSNAIKSLEQIIGNNPNVYWKRSNDDYFCQFSNGSRIYFMAENYQSDKQGTRFLGLETNVILLEQVEELQKSTYNILLSRIGSFHGIKGLKPPGIMLCNFNPSYTWVQKEIVELGYRGLLKSPHYFLKGNATDSPFNSKDQWRAWNSLDTETHQRMILGEVSTKFINIFMHAFNEEKNVGDCKEILYGYPIVLSFDFNVDPMTCTMMQTDGQTFIRFPMHWQVPNSDTYELCEYIKPHIAGREHEVIVTGDASGKNRISGTRGHINHYNIIQESLGIRDMQFMIPSANPFISDSRVFCNSIFEKFPLCIIDHELTDLIEDVRFTMIKQTGSGKIDMAKTGLNTYTGKDNALHGHALDNVRYALHTQLITWFEQIKALTDS